MNFENYEDVRAQLMDAGLLLDGPLQVGGCRSVRCRVDGRGREKRGWYWLHDVPIDGGYYLVGAFGVYEGNNPGTQKVELTKQCESCQRSVSFKEKKCPGCGSATRRRELSKEQQDAMRARLAENKKREDARRRRELDRAAMRADKVWIRKCLPIAEQADCPYLVNRRIQPHDARMTPAGTLVVPMQDIAGRVWGLQFIGPEVRKKLKDDDKQFWPYGTSQTGKFFMLGAPGDIILICEGFVTGAALQEETGRCVVVAFTAGNLKPVAEIIHKKYHAARLLICADDDFATRGNPGVTAATSAALAVGGAWVAPRFPDDEPVRVELAAANIDLSADDYKQRVEAIRRGRKKLTDFDDLRLISPPHAVRVQIEAKLDELRWVWQVVVRADNKGDGGRQLKPVTSTVELFDRFAIIYGHNEALFDFHERMLVSLKDMKLACSGREIWRDWLESREKKIVRIENVGFDPAEQDPQVTCNLWGGWPTEPKEGACHELLALLEYICSYEANSKGIYEWLLKWLAYPIQHPGAKMRTALVVHGPQQVGKNYFFETVMGIYGEYGQVINQDAIEDKYNDCFSKKLYLIADEVVARQEMRHIKNKLKGMITGNSIRINPKNVKSYWEKNHCNIIFLSNEIQPLMLERDDARHVVLWTPPRLSEEFYARVKSEVESGGQDALHYHLKFKVDLAGFDRFTPPPMTEAKRDLMDLGLDSTERFYMQWSAGKTDPVPFLPARSRQLHRFYREWCSASGYRSAAPEPQFVAEITRRFGAKKKTSRFTKGGAQTQSSFIFPVGHSQPPEFTELQWLSRCVESFSTGVSAWRDDEERT